MRIIACLGHQDQPNVVGFRFLTAVKCCRPVIGTVSRAKSPTAAMTPSTQTAANRERCAPVSVPDTSHPFAYTLAFISGISPLQPAFPGPLGMVYDR
jgi:hypothetical protein